MPAVFLIKAVIPKHPLDIEGFRDAIAYELMAQGLAVKKEYEKVTRTWRHKPDFSISARVEEVAMRVGGGATVEVSTDDAIFRYLDEGTKIRWALMSRDWKSKTRPRHIGSGPGAGRVVVAGRRYMRAHNIKPRPGIKARKFSKEIHSRRARPFHEAMKRAMKRAAANAWKG